MEIACYTTNKFLKLAIPYSFILLFPRKAGNKMKHRITIRFYEELNDFLPPDSQKKDICVRVDQGCTVGTLIKSFGPTDSDVDLILVNGRSVDFSHTLKNNDRVSVYPVFETFDISSITSLRNTPLRDLKFICDVHLGRLAKYLRMLGFDTWYKNNYADKKIFDLSDKQKRILLTKNKKLLENKKITRGFLIQHADPRRQLMKIVNYFDLKTIVNPLSRCLICNGCIEKINKEALQHRVKPTIRERYDTFFRCTECDHIYWKGSHFESMTGWIGRILNE